MITTQSVRSPASRLSFEEHPKWGLELDGYMSEFDNRFDKAFNNYMSAQETTGIAHDGLIPLSTLETMLTIGDNMHKVNYQHGEKSLPVLMATIRRYTELEDSGIFEYYYGYLCMRHLMRTVCIGTLIESIVLERFLNDLDPNMDAVEATSALAEVAFDLMTQALMKGDLSYVGLCLGLKPPSWDVFQCVGGLSFDDVDFLITVIWENRQRLITLIDHGMLAGFPALLFTICQMTNWSKTPESKKKWPQLQEIILRSYLAGVKDERITMRQLALTVHMRMDDYNLVGDYSTDPDDAYIVARTYSAMFHPVWNRDGSLASIILLDISNLLFRYVTSLLTADLADCIPTVAQAGLERLWLELDRERDGFMAAPRRGFTRKYASDILHDIGGMQGDLQTNEDEKAFSDMLVEMDILDLVGRLLLMISRETIKPDKWDDLIKAFEYLWDSMSGPIRVADELAQSNIANWIKIQDQLSMLVMGISPNRVQRKHLTEAIGSWSKLCPVANNDFPWKPCSNPRCAVAKLYMRTPTKAANGSTGPCVLWTRTRQIVAQTILDLHL
ncbi:hypothetical protein FRC12_003713 [Ceratobasidium sp. 428]|nr:hypothetical protein FRC12_003713 [Ceratobasidium sp. 428]